MIQSDKGFYNLASGMMIDIKRQEITARNIAAGNMPGYKKETVVSESFNDAMAKSLGKKTGFKGMSGPDAGKVEVDFSNGPLKFTGRAMDFALQGDGFFQIQSAEGKTMLTRNGSFFVNKDGFLVTNEGHKVLNDGGTPIQFAQDDYLKNMDVTLDGTIRLRENNTAFYSTKTIAKLKIAEVKDKSQLVRLSANYFATPAGAPPPEQSPAAKYKVNNNFLEEPNTSVVKEMVTMIDSQRQFEIGQRMIKSLTETYQSELRKLASG